MQSDARLPAGQPPLSGAPGESIAIICGGGSFPGAVADAVTRGGRRPVLFAIKGWAEASVVERYPHHWLSIGQVSEFFRLVRAEGCREVLQIGTIFRPPLSQIRLDWQGIRLLPRLVQLFRGGDDRLLSGLVKVIEERGLHVVGVRDVAPDIVVTDGVLGRHRPSPRDDADIARALALIATLGPFDVGQAAVVADNYVLAIEAAEGTDNMLSHIAELRGKGRVTTPLGVGVLVKAPKPTQDRRLDLPAIGRQTVDNAVRAGLAGIAVAAGHTIIADPADAVAAADRAGLFIVGVPEGRS